ncbi:MAG: hypothetical protein HGA66_10200 [Holophaga sp.]|nr:hypothetical protein [Holophaga sp.]
MRPETEATLVTEAVAELIALGAAMAANNEEAFQRHNFRLHKLGIAREDRIQAVNIALQVKMAPHRNLVEMAEGYLTGAAEPEGGCCGGECGCAGEEEAAGSCCGGDEGCGCGH